METMEQFFLFSFYIILFPGHPKANIQCFLFELALSGLLAGGGLSYTSK